MDCGSCRYFQLRDEDDTTGQCRAHPPVFVQIAGPGVPRARWPIVQTKDWCGEYAPRNKSVDLVQEN